MATDGCPVLAGYDPLAPGELRDPYPSYARAHREAPVFFDEQLGFWSVTRRADVLAVLRDNQRFSNRMALPLPDPPEDLRDRMPVFPSARALIFMDDPAHRVARKMVQAPFSPKKLRAMAPMIRERAEALLRPEDPDRRLEVIHGYATPLALAAISDIIGVPEDDFPLLLDAVGGANRLIAGIDPGDAAMRQMAEGQLVYWEHLLALVRARREDPRDDFASVLSSYRNQDGSAPADDEIAAQIHTILGAGFETSAQMMAHGIRSMLEQRGQWELLLADRSLLPRAVEECVRHRTLVRRVFRLTVSDVEIGGVAIPAGALVALLPGAANHDAAEVADPGRLDITREQANLAFGNGAHFCLGAPLSKLEMRITLETLLDLAPDMRLVPGQDFAHEEHLVLDLMRAMHVDLGPVPVLQTG